MTKTEYYELIAALRERRLAVSKKVHTEEQFCPVCNGTGEGQIDGSTCYKCQGSEIARDYEAEEDRKAEAADRWNDEQKNRNGE